MQWGKVDARKPLTLKSKMAENGVIFSDGLENNYLEFTAGITATIKVSDTQGVLVV